MLHKKISDSAWRNFFIKGKTTVNRSGFTLTEILVAVGIMSVITGIGAFSFLKYYESAKLFKIYKTGENFSKAVKICLIKYHDDPSKCADFRRLKFNCDYCASTVVFRSERLHLLSHDLGDSFRIEMTVDQYRSTSVYRAKGLPHLAVRIQEKTGTSLKFCSHKHKFLDGTLTSPVGGSVKLPIRKCASDSDCETEEHCHSPQMLFWNNGVGWVNN